MVQTALIISARDVERMRLGRAFREAGIRVTEAATGVDGMLEALSRRPDLIVLSEKTPPLDANDILLLLRRITDAPILILGQGGEPEEVAFLSLGADYYAVPPFTPRTIIARAKALLRRYRELSFENDLDVEIPPSPELSTGNDLGLHASSCELAMPNWVVGSGSAGSITTNGDPQHGWIVLNANITHSESIATGRERAPGPGSGAVCISRPLAGGETDTSPGAGPAHRR